MTTTQADHDETPNGARAEELFRGALLRSHHTNEHVGEVESAAAQF